MKTVKIFMTQGNDHQRPLTAEKASKSKVDKMTHLVAVVNFFPQPPCCSLHGPMYRVPILAELFTGRISPHSSYSEDYRCEHLHCHQQTATLSPGKGSNPLGTSQSPNFIEFLPPWRGQCFDFMGIHTYSIRIYLLCLKLFCQCYH